MELLKHQLEAIEFLGSGKILHGNVGVGKSVTALGYYMKKEQPKDIYVITTAKKRDTFDWEGEAATFGIGTQKDATIAGVLTVDSWNNMHKYEKVKDAFFIFDEQRLVGFGSWVKTFLVIAKKNNWILLSATPGDTWLEYAPVFIANGYYKNMTEFKFEHVVLEPFMKFPKVRLYLNEQKLERLRNEVLVEMQYLVDTHRNLNYLEVGYDYDVFNTIYKDRWNFYEDKPIRDVSEMFRLMRRVVNSDPSRLEMIRELLKIHSRLIIFYTFNYELDILRTLKDQIEVGEWNGHRKDFIPDTDEWVYLVQYTSGAEGWNCTSTNAMVLYSLTYSYKTFIQAQGRIDRMNTMYDALYYYILVSNSVIDRAIKKALTSKKSFNEGNFMRMIDKFEELNKDLGEEREDACQF